MEGERGVVTVELIETSEARLRQKLERVFGTGLELTAARDLITARQLGEYFAGKRQAFELSIDFSLSAGFEQRVLRSLAAVKFGEVISYGALAARAGSPGGARAVGGAMRRNPLPLVVPCHRVVAADGSLGGFTGGLHIKRELLRLEGQSV